MLSNFWGGRYVREVSPLELSDQGIASLGTRSFGLEKLNSFAYEEPVKYGFLVIYFCGNQAVDGIRGMWKKVRLGQPMQAGGEIAPLAQRYTLRVRYSPSVSDMRLRRAQYYLRTPSVTASPCHLPRGGRL